MDHEVKNTSKQFKDAELFSAYAEEHKARKLIADFEKEVKTRNNRLIENTVVVKALDTIINDESSPFCTEIEPGTILFRSRPVNIDNLANDSSGIKLADETKTTGYDEYDSKEAPLSIPAPGRSNIAGMSYLYLADKEYTSCVECRPDSLDYISVAKFRVKKRLTCINFGDDQTVNVFKNFEEEYGVRPGRLITLIMWEFTKLAKKPEDYWASQYISEYVRKCGFDAIKYQSSMSSGMNYTIFNCGCNAVEFVESRIVKMICQVNYFADINNEKLLSEDKEYVSSMLNSVEYKKIAGNFQSLIRKPAKSKTNEGQ